MAAPTPTTLDDLPVYTAGEAPEHLRTVTQLKRDRLKVADGQAPAGFLHVYLRGRGGWQDVALYDPAGAAPMRPLSAKQQAAKEARRTCPECGVIRGYVVHRQCADCHNAAILAERELSARTCDHCRRVSGAALVKDAYGWGACDPCRIGPAIRRRVQVEERAAWARTCPGRDCQVVTATDKEIAAVRAADRWGWSPRWCPPCKARDEEEQEQRREAEREAQRRAVEDRRLEVARLAAWAREVLEDPNTVVLDTETTGLHDGARIVDLGVTDAAGNVLVDTLLNPAEAIPAEATGIHGITDGMVAGAATFGDVLVRLTAALDGRRCLIYNEPYDVARLRHELVLHYRHAGHDDPEASAGAWLGTVRFEDVMVPYSDWYGDWSDYWGGYAWQPLYGGDHRALGDCRAVIERLKDMAATAAGDE